MNLEIAFSSFILLPSSFDFMGLIKSTIAPTTLSRFSMRDIELEAENILLSARRQAEVIMEKAQQESESLRKAALAQGHSEGQSTGLTRGLEQGRKAGFDKALEESRETLIDTISSFTAAAKDLDKSRSALEAH